MVGWKLKAWVVGVLRSSREEIVGSGVVEMLLSS